ncbi:MAG: polymerase [Fibrobacteres bacterium]|nr:polymerase [Fibrobacterota bacterium]
MMATAELIRAYLDWQSEMGTEDVILPHPLVRKTAAVSLAKAGSIGQSPHAMHPGFQSGQEEDSPAPKGPGYVEPEFQPGNPVSPSGGTLAQPSRPDQAAVAAELFQSLSKALEKSSDSRKGEISLVTGPGRTAGIRPSEASNLPVFTDLDGFWTYMESQPRLLQGEIPGTSSQTGADLTSAGRGAAAARVIRGVGPAKAPLALVGFEPGAADALEGKAFQGDNGTLLEKMMKAIRLDTRELYLTNLIKVAEPGKAWSRRELNRILPFLHIELGLAQAPMVLLLGQDCAQTVLKTGKPLEELRQETHRMEGREFFVTYHPQELLRKEELKRKAWEDLQWLQRRMAEAQART